MSDRGFYEGSDLGDKVFYGFRLNPDTGHLSIEVLDGDLPVSLPQVDIINKYDYKQWVWTKSTLLFTWGLQGHLHLKIL
jgi:hypothetical protein